jgi:hypothetical protein
MSEVKVMDRQADGMAEVKVVVMVMAQEQGEAGLRIYVPTTQGH